MTRAILAEYFVTEEVTLLFIGRPDFDEPWVVEVPRKQSEIRAFVQSHLGEQRDAAGRVCSAGQRVPRLDEGRFQQFFEPFVAPLARASPEGDAMSTPDDVVWLVPHDALHYVPLHAVRIEGRYLGERNPVCYTPSASVMGYCRESRDRRIATGRGPFGGRAVILADSRSDQPLLHARDQARAIRALLGSGAEIYENGAVTKTLVKKRFSEAQAPVDVLHVACHGYFSHAQPMQSGIALAPSDDASGQRPEKFEDDPANLTAEEIFGLRIDADLVTLSACQTGVSERRPGDELIGLTRALLYAGASSVIVTLWSVESISTNLLITEFYRVLLNGLGKAAALQQAELWLRALTATEVIKHCEEARRRLGAEEGSAENFALDWDIADVLEAARDFESARAGYERLLLTPDLNPQWEDMLEKAVIRCKLALRAPAPPDLGIHPFDRPFHWAPFILVGDWR